MNGVFCSNFPFSRGIFPPCYASWCPKCYKASDQLPFHINLAEDDEGIVWKRKKEVDKFTLARKCDNLFAPFQCDRCWFRNLVKRDPSGASQADQKLCAFIRRANLDLFWSRASDTVDKSRLGINRIIKDSISMGFEPSFHPIGPWPVKDECGFGIALITLKASLNPGKNVSSYTQYDTIRKLSSAYTNQFEASLTSAKETWVLKSEKSNSFFTKCPTRSEFFTRFKAGLRSRMGRDVKGDLAIDYRIMLRILSHLKEELLEVETMIKRRRWIASVGAFYTIGFTLALRGNEILMLDLSELRKNIKSGIQETIPHVIVPLLGRFKGEDFGRHHVLLAPSKSDSGFEPRQWLEWLVAAKEADGIVKGPAFSNEEGFVLYQEPFNVELKEQLEWAKEAYPNLFTEDLDLVRVKCSRSFRKGSTSRAQDLGLAQSIIDANNRWRTRENSKGSTPQLALRDHYSSVRLMSNKLLQYPKAM